MIRVSEQLVVIDFHQKGNPVRIFAPHGPENPKRRGYRVAAAFDGESDNVFRIERQRVGRE